MGVEGECMLVEGMIPEGREESDFLVKMELSSINVLLSRILGGEFTPNPVLQKKPPYYPLDYEGSDLPLTTDFLREILLLTKKKDPKVCLFGHGARDIATPSILLSLGAKVVVRESDTNITTLLGKHSDFLEAIREGRLIMSDFKVERSSSEERYDLVVCVHPDFHLEPNILVENIAEDGLLVIQSFFGLKEAESFLTNPKWQLLFRDGLSSNHWVFPTIHMRDGRTQLFVFQKSDQGLN